MINRYDEVDVTKVVEEGLVNGFDYDKDNSWCHCEVYILDELSDEDKEDLINQVEFEVIRENGKYRLKDLQGANLATIEGDIFDSLDDIIERLDVYWYDYLICIVDRERFEELKK